MKMSRLVAQSCLTFCDPMDCRPSGSTVHGTLQVKNTGVGCHVLLYRDLPDLGIEPRSPALQADSLPLSHQGKVVYKRDGETRVPGPICTIRL